MADRAFPKRAFHGAQEVSQVFTTGHEAKFIFGKGTQILPTLGAEIYGTTTARTVVDSGIKWFEFGFAMDHLLTGNPATGWTDPGNYFRLDYQWSADLLTWHAGKFLPAPAPIVDIGGGTYEYWARAIHPIDAAVKSGDIRASSGYPGGLGDIPPDTRNAPFTGLTLGGVVQPLGGFPYTMPGDAARMQTDLRSLGWVSATVESTSATVWRIIVAGVSYTAFGQGSIVSWPPYVKGVGVFGENLISSGAGLVGDLLTPTGAELVPTAFGRLKITRGTRYDAYL